MSVGQMGHDLSFQALLKTHESIAYVLAYFSQILSLVLDPFQINFKDIH